MSQHTRKSEPVGSRTGPAAAGLYMRSPAEAWTGQHVASISVANLRILRVVGMVVALLGGWLAVLLPVLLAVALVASVVGHGREDDGTDLVTLSKKRRWSAKVVMVGRGARKVLCRFQTGTRRYLCPAAAARVAGGSGTGTWSGLWALDLSTMARVWKIFRRSGLDSNEFISCRLLIALDPSRSKLRPLGALRSAIHGDFPPASTPPDAGDYQVCC
jgi:hypothetical protein